MSQTCTFCTDPYTKYMVYCRICAMYVCENARKYHNRQPDERGVWQCDNPHWCNHDGLAKKDRFTFERMSGGGEYIKDNLMDVQERYPHPWSNLHIALKFLNQLAFELELLKAKHVEDTE